MNNQTVTEYFRAHIHKKTNRYDDEDDDDYELPQDQVYIPPSNSTVTVNEDKNKIELLEKELNQLRNQMAMFLKMSQNNEGVNINQPSDDSFQTPTKNTCPPPPPPPPPPVPASNSAFNTPKRPAKQDKDKNLINSNQSNSVAKAALNLAEMVKLSGRKSLRKVEGERSPGGTIKKDKKALATPTSHSDIIADALKKKFKNITSPVSSPDKRDGFDEFD